MNRSTQQNNKTVNRDSSRFIDRLLGNLSTLITVMLFCAIGYGAVLAINHLDKPIAKVSIEGKFKYIEQKQFIELVNGQISGGFITIDLKALQNVLHQHPWVAEVSIQRQWPANLQINVVEEVPIARWSDDSFLNRAGDKLTIKDNSHLSNLPLMSAQFGSSSEVMKQYQRLADLLLPTGLKLAKLELDALGAWQVETSNGIQLILGRNHVGEKIRRLVMVWRSDLHQQSAKIKTIDLRYPNGLAVAWRNSIAVATAKKDPIRKTAIIRG
jgi:cell division protein FtsQ